MFVPASGRCPRSPKSSSNAQIKCHVRELQVFPIISLVLPSLPESRGFKGLPATVGRSLQGLGQRERGVCPGKKDGDVVCLGWRPGHRDPPWSPPAPAGSALAAGLVVGSVPGEAQLGPMPLTTLSEGPHRLRSFSTRMKVHPIMVMTTSRHNLGKVVIPGGDSLLALSCVRAGPVPE
ncbi:hypothetical protein BDY21DRAFT_131242 [Lineolata rhizophorae]|uniref:Uncharacterized protein n=1 Tax=Lineolata rhizophorae TaxID=578093 RepID=A0A6A6P9U9_9PEZI|nr:hypothetical protein BDY21DRAFT_131242 [Lineolata rhizophorae]